MDTNKLQIIHQFDQESLGISDVDGLDIFSSMKKFSEMAAAEIRKAYPGATVTVDDDPNCKTVVYGVDDPSDEAEIADDVKRIASDVWQDWKWTVMETTEFGTVEYQGKIYTLTEQATLSNRVFAGWWGDVADGESYTAEYWAKAIGPDGHNYQVTWQFYAVRGNEPEDEGDWPWTDSHIVSVELQ